MPAAQSPLHPRSRVPLPRWGRREGECPTPRARSA
ncbi:hypothetical protein [Caulobacter segnis]|nr:hypothetical protein [Caulobacter segnis]